MVVEYEYLTILNHIGIFDFGGDLWFSEGTASSLLVTWGWHEQVEKQALQNLGLAGYL